MSLALVTSECLITRKNEKESKRSKRKSSREHNKSLSLVTKAFVELGEDLISFVVLCNECWLLYSGWKLENLDAMNGGVVGVFIAPTTKRGRWEPVCSGQLQENGSGQQQGDGD